MKNYREKLAQLKNDCRWSEVIQVDSELLLKIIADANRCAEILAILRRHREDYMMADFAGGSSQEVLVILSKLQARAFEIAIAEIEGTERPTSRGTK